MSNGILPSPERHARLDPDRYALPAELRVRLLSPALVVYLPRVRENLKRMVSLCGGEPDRWQPHVKTSKIPEVFAEIAGVGVRHFKTATLRETRHLLQTLRERGVESAEVLLAYPLVAPALARLAALADAYPAIRLSLLCETPEAVQAAGPRLGVFVDVNPGMNRTGVPLDDRARITAIARAAGERFRGVHYYDGHLHGPPGERRAEVFACYDRLMELLEALTAAGVPAKEVVTSGTPTFHHALDYAPLRDATTFRHRVSPGTIVYHDLRTEQENPELPFEPAALVFARVVSHPTRDVATCDAGSKSLAAEAGDPCAAVLGRPDLVALTPSEEHLPLRGRAGELPERGTELYLFPRHVCPTVNLAEEACLIDGESEERAARVSARAHDLF